MRSLEGVIAVLELFVERIVFGLTQRVIGHELIIAQVLKILQHPGDGADLLLGVVDGADHGGAHGKGTGKDLVDLPEIVHDAGAVAVDVPLVDAGRKALHIVHHHVQIQQHHFNGRKGRLPAVCTAVWMPSSYSA